MEDIQPRIQRGAVAERLRMLEQRGCPISARVWQMWEDARSASALAFCCHPHRSGGVPRARGLGAQGCERAAEGPAECFPAGCLSDTGGPFKPGFGLSGFAVPQITALARSESGGRRQKSQASARRQRTRIFPAFRPGTMTLTTAHKISPSSTPPQSPPP
jgi:hypothetical protein